MVAPMKRMNIIIFLLFVMSFNISEAGPIMGPSARARECTRQYCASDEYVIKIKQYAMSIPQRNRDAMDALTCVTRKEQDLIE